jgi:hypothetical protein
MQKHVVTVEGGPSGEGLFNYDLKKLCKVRVRKVEWDPEMPEKV